MVQPVFYPSVRPYSDDFAVQPSVYGKLLPSQPASVYHGGPGLYLLHLLHRPRAPVHLPGLSTVPPSSTTANSDTTCSTVPGPRKPARTIDCSALPDHLFQPSWVGTELAPD